MTRAEFMDWLRSKQKAAHRPKDIGLVNCGVREPGDEDFAPVANLADRLQESLNARRMQSYGEDTREAARTR